VALSAELNSKNSLFFQFKCKSKAKPLKVFAVKNIINPPLILTALKYYQNQNQSLLLEKN
jgi:hypothetical protein